MKGNRYCAGNLLPPQAVARRRTWTCRTMSESTPSSCSSHTRRALTCQTLPTSAQRLGGFAGNENARTVQMANHLQFGPLVRKAGAWIGTLRTPPFPTTDVAIAIRAQDE